MLFNSKTRKKLEQKIVELSYKRYLLVSVGPKSISYRTATYLFDDSEGAKRTLASGVASKPNLENFTGQVLYNYLDLNSAYKKTYVNGSIVDKYKAVNGYKTAGQVCDTGYECWYNIECSGVYFTRIIMSVGGCPMMTSYPAPSDCRPTNVAQGWYLAAAYPQRYNCRFEPDPVPDPNPNPNPNPVPVPVTCTDCSGENVHCVNGNCEVGTMVYTSSIQDESSGDWACYYHYQFSDGFQSPTYITFANSPCS